MSDDGRKRRRLPRLTKAREYRLRRGVVLTMAAVYAGIPPTRASLIERFPERARPGELERLRAAVDRAASSELTP